MDDYKIQNARPLRLRRVVKVGSLVAGVPSVVRVEWTPIKTKNLLTFEGTIEDAQSVKPCNLHEFCKGHLCVSNGAYLIPYGFAVGGEIISSDGSLLNQAVIHGDKTAADVADYCFKRIATKRGIARKSCNGCRPVNSFRLVASPANIPPGYIAIPKRVMERARFMYVSGDGMCKMRKLKEGIVITMGRCPSQGADSAPPMRVVIGEEGVNSVGVPLEICRLTNADFDGDELWMLPPMSEASERELEECWERQWGSGRIRSVFASVRKVSIDNRFGPEFDAAMLTTMTFEEMGSHPGGQMYDDMILKPKSWKEMYKTMIAPGYWKTYVERCENGLVNTIMSRHGLAGPYGFMRMGMMLGTCVNLRDDTMVIDSFNTPELPFLNVPPDWNKIPCSSAITKLTKIMYQSGIDTSKHGSTKGKIPAISTLLEANGHAYGILSRGGGAAVALLKSEFASSQTDVYTNLSAIRNSRTPKEMLGRACMIVSMVEEIDSAPLTDLERIACAFLLSFLCANSDNLMNVNSVDLMLRLGLDWYTSLTCSDVRWIKNEMRTRDVNLSTDISSLLGSIFLGDMSLFASKPSIPHRAQTTVASATEYVTGW